LEGDLDGALRLISAMGCSEGSWPVPRPARHRKGSDRGKEEIQQQRLKKKERSIGSSGVPSRMIFALNSDFVFQQALLR